MNPLSRRDFLNVGATVAAATLTCPAWAEETLTAEQTLDELINQNQDSGLGSGFDSASRSARPPKPSLPTLSPATVESTQAAVAQYQAIVAKGGWPEVPAVARLVVGGRHAAVPALRERLSIGGDLELNSGDANVFDSYVEAAVRRFQFRHGLNADGVVRDAAWRALNVPAQTRLAQLKTNIARLKSLIGNLGDRVVVANIPAAQIEAVENGVTVARHTTMAGRPERPSPDVQSSIAEISINPLWRVPVSVIRQVLVPRLQAEPDYLNRNKIRVFDAASNELAPAQINWEMGNSPSYLFKQDPGDFNSLGSIRIDVPGVPDVYMHDTPAKSPFGDDFSLASPGSLRVPNLRELVYWLLAETPGWSRAEIDTVIGSGERKIAAVAKPLPLYWIYVTAWAAPDGVVQFRDDIYGRDGFGVQTNPSRG